MVADPLCFPRRQCATCGEWLPHYCAALVTFARERFTGRRVITITDRRPAGE